MQNKLTSLFIAGVIVVVLLLYSVPRSESIESKTITKLQKENAKLSITNLNIKKELIESSKGRDSINNILNNEIKRSKKLDSLSRKKDIELSKIQTKYNNILQDSIKKLLDYRVKESKLSITNEKWCLEKDDSVQSLKSIVNIKENIILEKDSIIDELNQDVSSYKSDSIKYNNIIINQDSISDNKDIIIVNKDKENKSLKKENKFLKVVAIVLGIIALVK